MPIKFWKYVIYLLTAMVVVLTSLVGCAPAPNNNDTPPNNEQSQPNNNNNNSNNEQNSNTNNNENSNNPTTEKSNVLIVYFSATGTTKEIATAIQDLTAGDIAEIVPAVPYSSADLNYNNDSCRANQEQNNPNARPFMANQIDVSDYDVVYVGFPIWWGKMPKIMFTFFDSQNFDNKTIMPFCTSGGSGIYTAVNEIKALEPNADVKDGLRVTRKSQLNDWVLPITIEDEKKVSKMYITINQNKLEVTLAENSTVDALIKELRKGAIVYTADDYGNFEKVGNLPLSLPRNDRQMNVTSGDVVYYAGSSLCLYYGSNSWSFTPIGKILGYSQSQLRTLLCANAGQITVTLSLT